MRRRCPSCGPSQTGALLGACAEPQWRRASPCRRKTASAPAHTWPGNLRPRTRCCDAQPPAMVQALALQLPVQQALAHGCPCQPAGHRYPRGQRGAAHAAAQRRRCLAAHGPPPRHPTAQCRHPTRCRRRSCEPRGEAWRRCSGRRRRRLAPTVGAPHILQLTRRHRRRCCCPRGARHRRSHSHRLGQPPPHRRDTRNRRRQQRAGELLGCQHQGRAGDAAATQRAHAPPRERVPGAGPRPRRRRLCRLCWPPPLPWPLRGPPCAAGRPPTWP